VFWASSKPLLSIAAPGSFVVGGEPSSTVRTCGTVELAELIIELLDIIVDVPGAVDDVEMKYAATPAIIIITITATANINFELDFDGLLVSINNVTYTESLQTTYITLY
jgi:hypothetical protein